MSNVARLKRQIVRDLVRENVELLEGRRPRRLKRRNFRPALRVAAVGVLSLGLFGSTQFIASLADLPAPPAPLPAAVASPVTPGSPTALPAPEPIDAAVFPLAVKKIVLDPGHGGNSSGTRTPSGLKEKDLTLDIAWRLRRLLEKQLFTVTLTREGDQTILLDRRAQLANQAEADVFVSIHVNWIEDRAARGIETYYLGLTDDPFLTRLAAAENRDSGYSLADTRELLDKIYAGVRQDHSKSLAQVVQGALHRSLGKINPQLRNRGVKAAPFIVLLSTEMPAILAEVSCLSNEEEAQLLAKPLYRQYIAEALAQGILDYSQTITGREGREESAEKGI
jgi:N-acetylmuramoyl-L-alanine amidase